MCVRRVRARFCIALLRFRGSKRELATLDLNEIEMRLDGRCHARHVEHDIADAIEKTAHGWTGHGGDGQEKNVVWRGSWPRRPKRV